MLYIAKIGTDGVYKEILAEDKNEIINRAISEAKYYDCRILEIKEVRGSKKNEIFQIKDEKILDLEKELKRVDKKDKKRRIKK